MSGTRLTLFMAGCLVAVIGLAALTQSAIVSAAVVTMVPDSELSVAGWGVGAANDTTCSGGTLCDTIDEGSTDKTADYIRTTSTSGGETAKFGLTDVANVDSATELTVRIYAQANTVGGGTIDTLNVSLLVNGTASTTQACTPGSGNWVACTATFSGTWNQADVNSMQVRIVREIKGSGKPADHPDDTQIANVSGSLTYALATTTAIDQSAYRWFQNVDAMGSRSFISAYGNTSHQTGQYSIAQLNDGGYAVVGGTGTGMSFISQYDANGDSRSVGSWGPIFDNDALEVTETTDGGYAVVGYLENSSGGFGGEGINQVALAKYDAAGVLEWLKTWQTVSHSVGSGVVQTSDGGYAVTGSINDNSTAFIAKYDASGNLSWNKTWDGSSSDVGNDIAQASDGGYVVTGTTSSFGAGSNDAFLAKYDASGNLSWSKTWGGSGNDTSTSVTPTSGGGYVISGTTSSFGAGSNDAFLAKYDASGNLSWSKTWGGSGEDSSDSMTPTSDGGYVIAGATNSFSGAVASFSAKYDAGMTTSSNVGSIDAFVAKYDASGNLSWSKTWGDEPGVDRSHSVAQTSDGGLVVSGSTGNFGAGGLDMVILRYNPQYEITNCSSVQCQNQSASTSSPSASTSSPSATAEPLTPTTGVGGAGFVVDFTRTEVAALTPSEIATGSALESQDTAALISESGIVRLRLNLHISQVQASASFRDFKLQFAPKAAAPSCSAVASGAYGDVTNSSSGIRWADNTNAGSGLDATASASDPKHGSDVTIAQTYLEAGTTTFTNKNAISVGEDGMWDFALEPSLPLTSASYCFRVVDSSGALLNSYSQYPELTVAASPPSIGFVDDSGNPLLSPSFAMTTKDYLSSCQTSTGTLGGGGAKLRVTQSGPAGNGWNVSIAPSSGQSAHWSSSGGNYYDFNDGSGTPAGCFAGSDGDTYAGQLTLNSGAASLAPKSGCTTGGLSLASGSTAFASGSVSSITLLTASSSATSGCYWDLSGIGLSQTIPPDQDPGSYTINLTATVTSS